MMDLKTNQEFLTVLCLSQYANPLLRTATDTKCKYLILSRSPNWEVSEEVDGEGGRLYKLGAWGHFEANLSLVGCPTETISERRLCVEVLPFSFLKHLFHIIGDAKS